MGSGFKRIGSLRTFNEYRDEEAATANRRSGVGREGLMLEYETLALRVHPPNVVIDNEAHETCTVITIDSANRPGTLVEVVQYLTEMGLCINSARISSDGGWFVDVFHVLDHGRKVTSRDKVDKLAAMLTVNYEPDVSPVAVIGAGAPPETASSPKAGKEWTTVFELAGQDRAGLLADVTQLLTCNGCDVRSAAVWTYRNRVAFVMSVMENGKPMSKSTKLTRLHELLIKMMGDKRGRAVVAVKNVKGEIHHDRRLHQRMLQEDQHEWARQLALHRSSLPSMVEERVWAEGDGEGGGSALGTRRSSVDLTRPSSPPPSDSSQASTTVPALDSKENLRSTRYSKPTITVTDMPALGYWVATIKCKDRTKLLFDTVCTLADMRYDVYHATIDSNNGKAFQEYFLRPCLGDAIWDEMRAAQLRAMLEVAVERRFPQGLKVHVHSVNRFGLLASLSRVLFENRLSIRRAVVKTHDGNASAHTFYVMDASGAPPNRERVEQACHMIGGKLVEAGSEPTEEQIKVGSGDYKFSFSFLNKQWFKEWSGTSASMSGSPEGLSGSL